jgi:methionine transaminase
VINFPSKLPRVNTTIFTVMSKLSQEHQAINLSQGFPDFDGPEELRRLTTLAMNQGRNQYAPMAGLQLLRERLAARTNDLHRSFYDPETEITVTAGGTQALFTAIACCIRPGDEVIIFEPAYDSYAPAVEVFGGVVKRVKLEPPLYRIDWTVVDSLITDRTRLLILNSPQNPTGTVLDHEDILELIRITRNSDILILSDEVYEHLIYDHEHLSMARFPELKERSFIAASFGKLFHSTGWKIGYCLAPQVLMTEFRKVHQFNVFSVNTPMQYAIAEFLARKDHYLELSGFFREKRDLFSSMLQSSRFKLLPCNGSYFQCAGIREITSESDTDFVMRLTREGGVSAIPVSAFYRDGDDFGIVRFCFAKKNETLAEAANLLTKA